MRFRRDFVAMLAAQSAVYDIRARQPAGSLAIIRRAVPPARSAGPSRGKTFGLALALAIILSIGLVLLLEQVQKARKDAYIDMRIREISGNLERSVPVRVAGWMLTPLRPVVRRMTPKSPR